MTSQGKPSILFLCDYQAPYGGNFIASMMQLDQALQARGVATCYLFPGGARERNWTKAMACQGKDCQYFSGDGFGLRLRELLKVLDTHHATILHVHFGYFALAEAVAILRPRLELILHFHSDFSGGRAPTFVQRCKDALKKLPELLIGKRLKKITVSQASARTTKDCIQLHNALCEQRFNTETWGREQTRAAHAIPEDGVLALLFGWSPWVKGVDVAVEAVRKIHEQNAGQLMLGVVCGRTYTKEKMQDFIRGRTGCSGDESWLVYLPPVEDVFRYHKAADVFVSASRSETFSYALLEAICTKTPCVASDIPGVSWSKQFQTVGFFPTQDSSALAQRLLETHARRSNPGFSMDLEKDAANARRSYAIEQWVERMLRVYGV